MSNIRKTLCQQCTFCKWSETDGNKIQIGCLVNQIDKYKKLKDRIDPVSHPIDNAVFKLTEMGNITAYIINYTCPFQRSDKWYDEHIIQKRLGESNRELYTEDELREYVFSDIPFDFGLVVISNGMVKGTLKTVRHVANGTVPPRWIEIVNKSKYNNVKFIEEIILALRDRMGKGGDIIVPDPTIYDKQDISPDAINARSFINFRQIADNVNESIHDLTLHAIEGRKGYFFIVVLQSGIKLTNDFMESIKRLYLDEFFDFHILSLDAENAVLVQPVFVGTSDFHPSAAYIWKNGLAKQEFNRNYVSNFFTIIDE